MRFKYLRKTIPLGIWHTGQDGIERLLDTEEVLAIPVEWIKEYISHHKYETELQELRDTWERWEK